MFNKIFLVAVLLCACYLSACSARPGSALDNLPHLNTPVGSAVGGAVGGAAGSMAGGGGPLPLPLEQFDSVSNAAQNAFSGFG